MPDEDYLVPIGKGIIRRAGKDVTLIGKLLTMYALAAAEVLAKDGIDAEVIDPRTLVPLDKELILESVRKTGRLVIVEEDNLTGGWAGEIAAIVAEGVLLVGCPDQLVSRPTCRRPSRRSWSSSTWQAPSGWSGGEITVLTIDNRPETEDGRSRITYTDAYRSARAAVRPDGGCRQAGQLV